MNSTWIIQGRRRGKSVTQVLVCAKKDVNDHIKGWDRAPVVWEVVEAGIALEVVDD